MGILTQIHVLRNCVGLLGGLVFMKYPRLRRGFDIEVAMVASASIRLQQRVCRLRAEVARSVAIKCSKSQRL